MSRVQELFAISDRKAARSLLVVSSLGIATVATFIYMLVSHAFGHVPSIAWLVAFGISLPSFLIYLHIDTTRMKRENEMILSAIDDELLLAFDSDQKE
jgi:hypothetical protein